MADKRISQFTIESNPDTNDFVLIDDGATNRRVRANVLAALSGPVTTVNTLTGDVVLDPDDLDDSLTDHKFVTQAQIDQIDTIKLDQGSDTFLAGDGVYRQPPVLDASNIGLGSGVLSGIVSSELQFKSLLAGDNLSITSDSDEITLGVAPYAGNSTATVTVGGLSSGTTLTGKTFEEILELILTPFQAPAFTAFSISGQSTTIEVGAALSGSKTFTWSTSNSSNVLANSVAIRDVTANTLIATSLANDGSESVAIGTIANTSPMSQAWRAEANNTQSGSFNSSNFTVSSIYPYFYGKSSSAIIANQALIDSGTKVVASSTGTITITYNSSSSETIWFAIPNTSTSKTVWYVNALNNGSIGGSSNFIGSLQLVEVDSPSSLWSDVNYKIYVANYPSAVTTIEFRNS